MITPVDYALWLLFRIEATLFPPKPLGLPACITIVRGDRVERLVIKKSA